MMDTTVTNTLRLQHRTRQFFSSTPVIIIFSYFVIKFAMATAYFNNLYFNRFDLQNIESYLFLDAFSVLIYFIIPLIVAKVVLDVPPSKLGLVWPKNRKQIFALLFLGITLTIPLFIYCLNNPKLQQYYQLKHISLTYFIFIQAVLFPIYYFAEEFFFRGFLFLTLLRKIGWHSYWISDLFFTLAHFGKPPIEILVSFPIGVVLNYMTYKTQSIFTAFVYHLFSGVILFSIFNYPVITS